MRKDRLEEFITDNRDAFDTEAPGLNLWAEIDNKINPKPRKVPVKKMAFRVSAGVAIVFIACSFLFLKNSPPAKHVNQHGPVAVQDFHPEFSEFEEHYARKINQNLGQLAALNHHDPDLYRDLRNMEAMYDTLQMEWHANPHKSDERLLNAMMENYRYRSDMLENVVQRLNYREIRPGGSAAVPAIFRDDR